MELIKLEVVTPDGMIFNDDVQQVTVPGSEGEFGVLAGHAAILTFLARGVISIEDKNGIESHVAINGGYVHVKEEIVLCMVDGAVTINKKGK
jgi:F-type H+-transporting ATPase subunit epsilon